MILQKDVLLKDHCNYQIGGFADYFCEFKSVVELIEALSEYSAIDPELKNIFILGTGTNVLFSDFGYKGLVLKNSFKSVSREGVLIEAKSGVSMDELIEFVTLAGLSGFEWAGGLPGTVGGAVRGNAGAFGGETKDRLVQVESLDIKTLQIKIRNNSQCDFDYRNSVFKSGVAKREIVLSVKFELESGSIDEIKEKTQEKIDYRIEKHPLDKPNIGSIFKNVPIENVPDKVLEEFKANIKQDPFPVLPVAKLIVSTDLVGRQIGGAQISTKHPNFIVNLGDAKAADVLGLIDLVKKEIKEKFRIEIEEEVMIV